MKYNYKISGITCKTNIWRLLKDRERKALRLETSGTKEQHGGKFPRLSCCLIYPRLETEEGSTLASSMGTEIPGREPGLASLLGGNKQPPAPAPPQCQWRPQREPGLVPLLSNNRALPTPVWDGTKGSLVESQDFHHCTAVTRPTCSTGCQGRPQRYQ